MYHHKIKCIIKFQNLVTMDNLDKVNITLEITTLRENIDAASKVWILIVCIVLYSIVLYLSY